MKVNALIVGGGPAGLATLISASRVGLLDRIVANGIAVAERGRAIGAGRIGRYAVNSDSTATTLVSCIGDNPHRELAALCDHPVVKAVAAYGSASVPLTLVGELMNLLGGTLSHVLKTTGNSVLLGHEAISTTRTRGGTWRTKLRRIADGTEIFVDSRFVVLATGGHQPLSALEQRRVAGHPLVARYAPKLVQSDDALTTDGLARIAARLAANRRKRIAIIGSSSSAMACASALLQAPFGRELGDGAIALLHRRPLRIFYPSAAEALADGYDEFTRGDICPISGFVYRLAGLRLEARELLMAVRGIGGRAPERRLRAYQVGAATDATALRILDEAEVIVAALGYRPRALPVLRTTGEPIELLALSRDGGSLVDGACRVLDARQVPIDGLFGIGLASGFFSREVVGGELSFSGQTNSLWQWQNAVGALIARQIQTIDVTRAAMSSSASMRVLSRLQSI